MSLTLGLADSFDVLPNGKCADRTDNRGMSDGARVQLRGDTDGGSVWSVASAQISHRSPPMRNGKPLYADDGLYCVVTVVFAPTRPDPNGSYSIKFVGGNWRSSITVGRAPFGQVDRPGYGSASVIITTCGSLADPPDKDCPERGN